MRQGAGAVTTLTDDDAEAIRQLDGVRWVSPGLNTRTQIIGETSNWNTQVQGVGEELADIRAWPVQFGRFLSAPEVRSGAKVVVLGAVVRDQLFGAGVDPVGASVRINNQPFRIVGVLTSKGQAAFGQDQDDVALIPIRRRVRRLLGVTHVSNITVSAVGVPMEQVADQIGALLRERHRLAPEEDDFSVRTQAEMTSVLTSTTTTMTYCSRVFARSR